MAGMSGMVGGSNGGRAAQEIVGDMQTALEQFSAVMGGVKG